VDHGVAPRAHRRQRRGQTGRTRADDVDGLAGFAHSTRNRRRFPRRRKSEIAPVAPFPGRPADYGSASVSRTSERPPLPFEFDAVVIRQGSPHDLLQAALPSQGSNPLPFREPRIPAPDGLPPEQIHGAAPSAVEKGRRRIEGVRHRALKRIVSQSGSDGDGRSALGLCSSTASGGAAASGGVP